MDKNIKQIFTEFLLENNAYSQYVINLLESRKMSIKEFIDKLGAPKYYKAEHEFINWSFAWCSTPEGYDY